MSSYVGIDIGNGNVKIALREGGVRLISRRLPDNMVSDDDVIAPETMALFLKQVREEERIRTKDCALVLAESNAYFRHVTLPPMTVGELKLNLPYEFRDFIEGDPAEWCFDYAVDNVTTDDEGKPTQLDLYAAAAKRSLIEERAELLRRAGFRLKAVIPAPMAYTRLLRSFFVNYPEFSGRSVVFVDIGYTETAALMFSGERFQALRTINVGCEELDTMIADLHNIDRHTASSYKDSNFRGVLDTPEATGIYDRIALEINKVVNFYNFSNPDQNIEAMFVLGGGAQINQLVNNLTESFDIHVQRASALLPSDVRNNEMAPSCTLAFAGLLEGEVM